VLDSVGPAEMGGRTGRHGDLSRRAAGTSAPSVLGMQNTTTHVDPSAEGHPAAHRTRAGNGPQPLESPRPLERGMRALGRMASRAGRGAAVAAVTVGLAAGVAAPASAAPAPTAGMNLTIHKLANFTGYYKMYISGVFPMSQAEARRHVAELGNGGVEYDVFGDDSGVGDSMILSWVDRGASLPGEKPSRYLYAAPDGLRFFYSSTTRGRYLDEDDSWSDRTDEIYARAWFVDRTNTYRWGSTSNVVTGNF
jgi:hypothetical protein